MSWDWPQDSNARATKVSQRPPCCQCEPESGRFLGMEEAGGKEVNMRTRLKFRRVIDNAEAHKCWGSLRRTGARRSSSVFALAG